MATVGRTAAWQCGNITHEYGLPRAHAAGPPGPRRGTPLARILVVDDSSVVRRMLGLVLRDGGHQVSFAANGQEGLTATRAARPDLVISDLEMPVMDGISFLRQLK